MDGVKENNRIKQYIVPVLAATAIMVLVFLTLPMTAIPAKVMGGYGSIGPVGYTVADVVDMGTPGTVPVVLSGPDAYNVDPSSLTFAGAPVVSWSYDANGNLVLVFDKSKMNLKPGDTTAMLSGNLKNGTPFGGAVAVTVVQ
jgi:hypothetical protein